MAARLSPEAALEINVAQRRARARQNHRDLVETPVRERIAGQDCRGVELLARGGGKGGDSALAFHTRLFTLTLHGHTVLVGTLSATTDDDLTRTLLAPVAASLR